MAFAASGLFRVAQGGGHAIWFYFTTDAATDVDAAGYFNTAIPQFNIGDIIFRITTSSGALSTAGIHVVKDVSATAVDVTDTTALTVTDSD